MPMVASAFCVCAVNAGCPAVAGRRPQGRASASLADAHTPRVLRPVVNSGEALAGAYRGVMSVPSARVRPMRLLHTSDWHLGRSLHRADLRAAQSAFLDHLVDVARAEKVDAVLVAGDIYDRAVPPVDAVELCEDALLRLHDTGARIVLISGNHDSARRLGFGSGLLEKAGVHLRTRPGALARPVVLTDIHGPVAVYGVPYLEPDAVRDELPPAGSGDGTAPRGHAGVLGHAVAC